MAVSARKGRLFSRANQVAARKGLLLLALVCVAKLLFAIPVFFLTTHPPLRAAIASLCNSITSAICLGCTDFRCTADPGDRWRPDVDKVHRVYEYLNLTEEEAQGRLPLTLNSPFLLNNEGLCGADWDGGKGVGPGGTGQPVDVLFVVHTAPANFRRRLQIRTTIAEDWYFTPFRVRVVFLLGTVGDKHLQRALDFEHAQYRDSVQGDFVDSYRNLSHKGVLGLRWVTRYCRHARYVIKMDDDVFFDTFKMLVRYRGLFRDRSRSIFCNVLLADSMPIYRNHSVWSVEPSQFQGLDVYPYAYCSGLVAVMTGDLVPDLFRAASFTPVFWIDDLYLFGMLPSVAGNVTLLNLGHKDGYVSLDPVAAVRCLQDHQLRCPVLAALCPQPDDWQIMWNLTYHLHVETHWRIPYLRVE